MFQPWGRVSLDTQYTPQGANGQQDLTYGDLFHTPHFLPTSKASTMTDTSVSTRFTPSVSAQLDDLDAFLSTSRRFVAITYIKILTLAQSMVFSLWRCVPLVVSTIV